MRSGPLILVISSLVLPLAAYGAGKATYDFKDPKNLNSVMLVLDSPIEPMVAMATGVSGTLAFDPADPGATTGKIVVDAASVQFPNPGITATAHGPDGFDVQKFPTIEFVLREVRKVRKSGGSYAATVSGDFTCRGITKRLSVEATLTHLPGKAAERHRSGSDLLVLRSTFKIHRRDFGIKPRKGDEALAEDIEVRLGLAGAAP
jgi:polyisoprenoid-binding protein YceI